MDRSELRERARTLSGVLMPTLLSDAQANAYLNEAYHGVNALAEWSYLYAEETVVTSDPAVSLPGGIGRVQDVVLDAGTGQRLLQRRTLQDLSRQPGFRNTGSPWAWAPLAEDRVRIFPDPGANTSLVVRGWTSPAPLGLDTATPVFADEFHVIVAYEAAAAVLEAEGDDSGRTQAFRDEVSSLLDRMARRYLPDGGQVAYPPADARTQGPAPEQVEA